MIKRILSVVIITVIFSGCVGTLVATNNTKDSKATTVHHAKSNSDSNITIKNSNETILKNKK